MPSLQELRQIASTLDTSLSLGANEVGSVLAALVHYLEHGDALTKASEEGPQAVSDLLSPKADPTDDELAASSRDEEIAKLRSELDALTGSQTAAATAGQTTVTHQPGAPPAV